MREIKFRGKVKDMGHWIYGDAIFKDEKVYISKKDTINKFDGSYFGIDINLGFEEYRNIYEIEPDSLGQYIGFMDKKGKMIYEGDIVVYKNHHCLDRWEIDLNKLCKFQVSIGKINNDGVINYGIVLKPFVSYEEEHLLDLNELDKLQIVGNAYKKIKG